MIILELPENIQLQELLDQLDHHLSYLASNQFSSLSTMTETHGGLEKLEIIQISNYEEELVGTGVQIDSYMKTIMDSSICHRRYCKLLPWSSFRLFHFILILPAVGLLPDHPSSCHLHKNL